MEESLFMGKVTAAMTHDMQNVLAIISEAAGLAQDLLVMSDDSVFPLKNRLIEVVGKIEGQVARGSEIVGELNRFSHVPDDKKRQEDMDAVLNQTIFLSAKLSRLNQVTLKVEQLEEPIILNYNPLKSRMLVYRTLEFLTPLVGKGSEIILKPVRFPDGKVGVCFKIKTSTSGKFKLEEIVNISSWGDLESEFVVEGVSIRPSENNILLSY
ncbi:MAG: hypothetical protein ACP5U1_03640 [Desulfomonilaceae bacterium]